MTNRDEKDGIKWDHFKQIHVSIYGSDANLSTTGDPTKSDMLFVAGVLVSSICKHSNLTWIEVIEEIKVMGKFFNRKEKDV